MPDQEKQAHLATDPNGFMRGCRCDLTDDHDVAAFGPFQFVAGGPVDAPRIRVAELRPRGIGKTTEQEAWRAQERLTDAFVSNAMRVHAEHQEQTLREMVRAALKLVEENPPNEPMRTPVSRPAVERMLAEDLERLLPQLAHINGVRREHLQTVAGALFDAGWRPTIERLAR